MGEITASLFDIYGRPLVAGDQVLVEVGRHRHNNEAQIRVAVLEQYTGYRLRYQVPTESGVASSNLAYCDELSDLQNRKAVKVVGANDAVGPAV